MLAARLRPAAKMGDICQDDLVVDPMTVRRDLRDGIGISLKDKLIIDFLCTGTVEILGLNDLRLIGIQIVQVFRGSFLCPVLPGDLVDDSDRGLAQDRDGGNDDLILSGILLQRKESLILPCQENISLSVFHKRGCGTSRSGIQHNDIPVQFADRFEDLLFALPLLLKEIPGSQIIPHRPSRGLRIGGDHSDIFSDQITPVIDLFRIAASHKENDR